VFASVPPVSDGSQLRSVAGLECGRSSSGCLHAAQGSREKTWTCVVTLVTRAPPSPAVRRGRPVVNFQLCTVVDRRPQCSSPLRHPHPQTYLSRASKSASDSSRLQLSSVFFALCSFFLSSSQRSGCLLSRKISACLNLGGRVLVLF
jgi:hypothetical protein